MSRLGDGRRRRPSFRLRCVSSGARRLVCRSVSIPSIHHPASGGGDLVAVMPDRSLADFIVERGYIGRDLLLMKYVAALPGQRFAARATL